VTLLLRRHASLLSCRPPLAGSRHRGAGKGRLRRRVLSLSHQNAQNTLEDLKEKASSVRERGLFSFWGTVFLLKTWEEEIYQAA
jgi:hypothetical protein